MLPLPRFGEKSALLGETILEMLDLGAEQPFDAFPVAGFIIAANIRPPWVRLRSNQKSLIKRQPESVAYVA